MWSILENVPCTFEKKVYSSAFGWKVLKISIRSIWPNVSFKVCVSLLILCFDDLSIDDSGVLKSPTIIVLLLISPLMPVQFSSVTQSCPTLCDPMNCSMPGLPVHHQLPEFTQTHVHRVSDAIQPSHPLLSPSSPAPNPSQHQRLFQ